MRIGRYLNSKVSWRQPGDFGRYVAEVEASGLKRHLAIGDIHGCYDALRKLCDFVELGPEDTIITLGDYPNPGPDTNAVLDWLIYLQSAYDIRPLRGNHDIMMLNAREDDSSYRKWIDVGGDKTLQSYAPFDGDTGSLSDIPESHWDFLENNLLSYFETETHFFVHANAYPEISLADQPDFMLYWEPYDNPPKHESGKIMVCGHTSQKSGLPIANSNAVCIDTWAHGGGWLSCLHVESGMIWQSNQHGETRRLWLDELRCDDAE
ncbi:metallophosphoesterase [Planctopirus limnophila]|uniref:metallophosphoesterase n=1 Tax=Planctopirus limnophila TaxID=120 RepID=UPI0001A2F8FF|nr:metallophosphoesterase [Planctopirus limnophila]